MENCTCWAGRIDRPEVRTREREREERERESLNRSQPTMMRRGWRSKGYSRGRMRSWRNWWRPTSLPPSRSTRSVTRAAQARSRALKVYGSSFVSALFPCVFFGDACSCAPRNDRGDFYQVFLGRELLCPFSILHGARFHPWLGRSFPSVQFERYFSNTCRVICKYMLQEWI